MRRHVARLSFTVGQRVQMTEKAREHQLNPTHTQWPVYGTVRGFGRYAEIVRVQRDGVKSIDGYNMGFWEPIKEEITDE